MTPTLHQLETNVIAPNICTQHAILRARMRDKRNAYMHFGGIARRKELTRKT
jgi:hypothetical protein